MLESTVKPTFDFLIGVKVLTQGFSYLCLHSVDLQMALYELCWHVVHGGLKVDVAASLLADAMVSFNTLLEQTQDCLILIRSLDHLLGFSVL